MAKLKDRIARLAAGKGGLSFDPLAADEARLATIRLDAIEPDPNQPRKDVGDLKELKQSIRQHGILQPLVVSPLDDHRYRLISGERRYTAARELELRTVPALIRAVKDHHRLEQQLIENLHRKDLDPFEEADGYRRLADEFNLTHADIAEHIGKSRVRITETLSLSKIPPEIREECRSSDIPLSRDTLYLIAKQPAPEKMRDILKLALQKRPIEEKRHAARKGSPRSSPGLKPKIAYATNQDATVIVQSKTTELTQERTIAALQEALKQARSNA